MLDSFLHLLLVVITMICSIWPTTKTAVRNAHVLRGHALVAGRARSQHLGEEMSFQGGGPMGRLWPKSPGSWVGKKEGPLTIL